MPRPRLRIIAVLAMVAAVLGCSKDVVLPDDATEPVCGNFVLESGEACDVASAGCVGCQVAPNWTCAPGGCTQSCGDGVIADDPSCLAPRRDTDCDLTGYWAARATDFERDAIVGNVQVSSNWSLFHLTQSGDDFRVDEQLDCGLHVTGSATVDYTPASLRAIVWAGRMDAPPHGPLHGTSRRDGAGCAMTIDRFYKVRGATDRYLPADFSTKPSLAALAVLPSVSDPVKGTDVPPETLDPDGDGVPGLSFAVNGLVSGTRNSAQRDWKEYATHAGAPVPAAAVTLVVPGAFDMQENVLRVSDCGTGCALLASGARAAGDLAPHLTLSFIGRTLGSARVSQVVVAAPRKDIDQDLTTCARVRLVLPHDPQSP